MIVFITSVRHPENSKSYQRVWDLLNDTLYSVCKQKDQNLRVIVVNNKKLTIKRNIKEISKKTEFIQGGFPPISQKGTEGIRIDRGSKYVIGLLSAKKYNPDYVMFFDADDFIENNISEYVNKNLGRNGWIMDKGYQMIGNKLREVNCYESFCGTGNIFNYNLLYSKIPEKLTLKSSRDEIVNSMDDYFLRFILGSHRFSRNYFKNLSKEFQSYPSKSVIQLLDTGENRSDNWENTKMAKEDMIKNPDLWIKISKDQIKNFNIKQPNILKKFIIKFLYFYPHF